MPCHVLTVFVCRYFGVRGHYIQYNGTGYSKMHASVRILEFKVRQQMQRSDAGFADAWSHRVCKRSRR